MSSVCVLGDTRLWRPICDILREAGHCVMLTGLRAFLATGPAIDLVILDATRHGTEACRLAGMARAASDALLLVVLPSNAAPLSADVLNRGADDCVVGHDPDLIVAKARALLRRCEPPDLAPALTMGNVAYDVEGRQVRVAGQEVRLSPQEHRLLALYLERPNQPISKEELARLAWQTAPSLRAVEEANRRLRRKLLSAGATAFNATVWGFGYRFEEKDR